MKEIPFKYEVKVRRIYTTKDNEEFVFKEEYNGFGSILNAIDFAKKMTPVCPQESKTCDYIIEITLNDAVLETLKPEEWREIAGIIKDGKA